MTYQEYISSGGTPYDWYNLPENGGAGAAAPDNSGAQALAQQGGQVNNGFQPITDPGFTQNNVGTGPVQESPGADDYGQNIQTHYNPNLYADDATAARIAQQLGGTVVKGDPVGLGAPGSPFTAPQGNMIQLPNGRMINAGTIAGYEQTYANNPQMLQALINGEITGTGQNQSAYQNSFNGWDPAAVAQAGYKTSSLPNGAAIDMTTGKPLNTGGTTTTGGGGGGTTTTGGGGTTTQRPGGGNTGNRSISQANTLDPRDPTNNTTTPGVNTDFFPGLRVGGYPSVGSPQGMPLGTGAIGGYPIKYPPKLNADGSPMTDANGKEIPDTTKTPLPDWSYNPSTNPGDILSNSQGYAYTQGGELIQNYGSMLAQQQQRAAQLSALGDSMYANLQANPGYTTDQQKGIMDQSGLDALQWNQGMADQNFLNKDEQASWTGDPMAAYKGYAQTGTIPSFNADGSPVWQKDAQGNVVKDADGNPVQQKQSQADYLNQLSRQYGGNLQGMYDKGATAIGDEESKMGTGLSNAIDPAQLGLSNQFTQNYNWTPEDSQNIINAAGRNVGMQTAAIQDQLQRQAAAAGSSAPLALSAALARQRQTGDVAGADAMTNAAIQAKQQELTVQQQLEQMRLGTAQDLSTRQMQEATTMGNTGIAAQEYLTSGRAAAGLQTGLAQMNEQNTIAGQESSLTQAGEVAAQQRAQAMAQNRQQISQANQGAQFQRGSYTDQATSQRSTQEADAARADQTQARQDVRNEEMTGYNEANSQMAGQLQAFTGVTGAGQASEANAIRAAQLPTTFDKVVAAGSTALGGTNAAEGGIFNKPTKARVGEKGPEIVIKLKHMGGNPMSYRRRNEAAYA